MTSTFRLLLAAMPDIAQACEKIGDPQLRDKAFDTLVQAARDGGEGSAGYTDPTFGRYSGATYGPGDPLGAGTGSYDPTSTRVDNGLPRG